MRTIVSILAVILFIGCINKNKIPETVLPQDQMRNVMWDLMRTDQFVDNFIKKDSTLVLKTERAKLYEQVFQLHVTSREVFKQSLDFYQSRPDLLKVITDSLRNNERKAMQNQYSSQGPGLDSLKKRGRSNAIKSGK